MIDVLEQLVADGKHREAIKLAEQILRDGVQGPAQLVEIQSALVVAHCSLGEWEPALAPGEAVLSLAREIGEWDAYGRTAMFISTAYSRLGQDELAVARTYDYIAHLGEYQQAASYEVAAWFNLGGSFIRLLRPADAVKALARALTVAEQRGDPRDAHGVRHYLIAAHLKARDYQAIPRLLAKSAAYLRHNPEGWMVEDSWVYHMRLRAEYALATERPRLAMAIALRGLDRTGATPHHSCRFHILLAKVGLHCNSPFEAVGHALAAQSLARESGRPDVETEASEVLYQVSHAHPDALGSVDHYYLTK